jgi:uncharacterized protein
MLTVKTTVQQSKVQGLGLFAAEKILKGTSIWKFDPRFDIFFEPDDMEKMGPLQRDFIKTYAYLSTETGKYVLCTDDARFMNHSSKDNNVDVVPFPGEVETRAVANRDIESGEEILINYRSIDSADVESEEEYLKN